MNQLKGFLQSVFSVFIGISLGLLIAYFYGENPLFILEVIAKSAFGSLYDFGMSLFYATPLIFTGLAVAVPFRAGLFNIGAEGQMTMGILAASVLGVLAPTIPAPIAIPLTVILAFVVGGLWGAIPGWMRAQRGAHEVISTIMLNFIAAGLASWVTLGWIRNKESMNPESQPVGASFLWHIFSGFDEAPVSMALVMGLIVALIVWIILWKMPFGFEIRAVGESEATADFSGINVKKIRILSMALGGGIAGLAAIGEVFANSGKFKMAFSADYGFMGIAVALLGKSRPAGIIAAAFLFGALHKGAGDLDFETEFVTRDLASVMQSFVIIAVAAEALWSWWQTKKGLEKS